MKDRKSRLGIVAIAMYSVVLSMLYYILNYDTVRIITKSEITHDRPIVVISEEDILSKKRMCTCSVLCSCTNKYIVEAVKKMNIDARSTYVLIHKAYEVDVMWSMKMTHSPHIVDRTQNKSAVADRSVAMWFRTADYIVKELCKYTQRHIDTLTKTTRSIMGGAVLAALCITMLVCRAHLPFYTTMAQYTRKKRLVIEQQEDE